MPAKDPRKFYWLRLGCTMNFCGHLEALEHAADDALFSMGQRPGLVRNALVRSRDMIRICFSYQLPASASSMTGAAVNLLSKPKGNILATVRKKFTNVVPSPNKINNLGLAPEVLCYPSGKEGGQYFHNVDERGLNGAARPA